MSVQSAERQGGDSATHITVTGDKEGNSAGVYTVTRSWKHHSTDGILGISQGEAFPLRQKYRELEREVAAAERVEVKQEKLKKTLSKMTLTDGIK